MQYYFRNPVKISLCMIFFIFAFLFPISSTVLASENIKINVSAGFSEEYKIAQWVPIKISLTNDGDQDFDGNIIVEIKQDVNNAATYNLPATIAKKTTKEFSMNIPGQGISPNVEVKLLNAANEQVAETTIGGRVHPENTFFIGVLASDKDTANFLGSFSKDSFSYSTRIVSLEGKDIPLSASGLKGLDMLLINNYPLDSLSGQQKKVINQWTKDGGLLVLAGGAQYYKIGNEFADISPVNVINNVKIDKLTSLEQAVNKELIFQNPLTISNSILKNGSVIYAENSVPVFALNKVSSGQVLYVAYDLAEEPLASWAGNRELWSNLLSGIIAANNPKGNLQPINNIWALKGAADRIPSLQLPKFSSLFSLFLAYIFIIGPVIYFVLKRTGKREWNWLIIPLVALLAAFSVFQLASLNRSNNVMMHNTSIVEVTADGVADIHTVSAIFVPKGGDYSLEFKNVDVVLPANDDRMNAADSAKNTWISIQPNQTSIQFNNVEFWSLRKAYSERTFTEAGSFESYLQYKDGKLVGTILNKTKYDLQDAKYFDGLQVVEIGNFPAGSSVELNVFYQQGGNAASRYGLSIDQLLPNNMQGNNFNYDSREYQLLQAISDYNYGSNFATPILLGWTNEPMVEAKLNNKSDNYNLSLIKGYLEILPASDGSVFYPPGIISANLSKPSAKLEFSEDGYRFSDGSLEFDFNVKNDEVILDIEKLQFFIWSYDNTNFEKQIYNWRNEEFVSFQSVLNSTDQLTGENIEEYLSTQGVVKIKITNISNSYTHLGQPAISVVGRVVE